MPQIDLQYKDILHKILTSGFLELNERTGHTIRALPGITVEVTDGFPLISLRKIPYKVFIAEQIWFLTGNRKPEFFLNKHTKIWNEFSNIDGVVTSAYGYRWRHHFGRDQIADLIKLLELEPSSRQGVVIAWDPADDGLCSRKKANVPCPYTFIVNILGGKLHMHNIVRSNDMILGFPHDVGGFALLQRILANKLQVGVGKYTHTIAHAHIYDIHFKEAKELSERNSNQKTFDFELPKNSFRRAEEGDDSLLESICSSIEKYYTPLDGMKNLKIVK